MRHPQQVAHVEVVEIDSGEFPFSRHVDGVSRVGEAGRRRGSAGVGSVGDIRGHVGAEGSATGVAGNRAVRRGITIVATRLPLTME